MRNLQKVGQAAFLWMLLFFGAACNAAAGGQSQVIILTTPLEVSAATEPSPTNATPLPIAAAESFAAASSAPTATPEKTPSPAATASPAWPMKTFKYKPPGYVTASAVNLRAGPGTAHRILTKASYHAEVTMLAESGDWYYVSLDGTEGFISKAFVVVGSLPTPTPSPEYSNDAIYLAAQMIWLEAKNGTYEEYQAIATVLANRMESRIFPATVEENIFAPGQFSVADDREWFLSKKPSAAAIRAADSVLNGGERTLESSVMYFRAKRLGTEWPNRSYVKTIGNHCFFR